MTDDDRRHWIHRACQMLMIGVFFIGISLPLVGSAIQLTIQPWPIDRPLPPLPSDLSSALHFPERFLGYFRERFVLRRPLAELYGLILTRLLLTSPNPSVVMGYDGWFYLMDEEERQLYRRSHALTEAQLQMWSAVLQRRQTALADRGIRYLFVLAPNNSTIYPEYVPRRIRQVNQPSRTNQLVRYLAEHTDVNVLDLRDALIRAKANELLYDKTDTHWNDLGSLIAYQEIMRRLELKPLTMTEFERVVEHGYGGDLMIMLKLVRRWKEIRIRLKPRWTRWAAKKPLDSSRLGSLAPTKSWPWWARQYAMETNLTNLPRVLVLRDSFTERLVPFLSEHFERATYLFLPNFTIGHRYRNPLDLTVIEAERPHIVVEEMVERYLMREPPVPDESSG